MRSVIADATIANSDATIANSLPLANNLPNDPHTYLNPINKNPLQIPNINPKPLRKPGKVPHLKILPKLPKHSNQIINNLMIPTQPLPNILRKYQQTIKKN